MSTGRADLPIDPRAGPRQMTGMDNERPNLTDAARRALAEAEERRKKAADEKRPPEKGGRDGPEPVRYGDWEVKGIASDF